MKRLTLTVVGALVGLALVVSCASMGEWLDQPAGEGVSREGDLVTITDPDTGVGVTAPGTPSGEASVETPDGSTVTLTPAPRPAEPTRGDVVADAAGGVATLATGNPMIGVLLASLASNLLGAIPRKKRVVPVAA